MKTPSLLLLISTFFLLSCETQTWEAYVPKEDVCSQASLDSLADLQTTSSFYFVQEDVAAVLTNGFAAQWNLTEEEQKLVLNQFYSLMGNKIWHRRFDARTLEFKLKSKGLSGFLTFGEGEAYEVMTDWGSITQGWQLEGDCAKAVSPQLARIFNLKMDPPFNQLQSIMKVAQRELKIYAYFTDKDDESYMIEAPVGYGLHYGPW